MKRKRDSVAVARATSQRGNETKGKVEEAKSDELCPYFDNLPSHLTAHILLQLPLKSLPICKCVCKNWKTTISEPHFAKLHFEQEPTSLMIRTGHRNRVARTMHLLEFEPEKFEIGNKNHVKLEPIFKLPLRDTKSFREKRDEINKRLYIACNSDDDKFNVVNSCHGFICLCHPNNNIPLVICNPVTGEFIRLPEATTTPLNTARVKIDRQAGFGFHSKTNEYKVINMWRRSHIRHEFEPLILEIHTLGTLLWRNVEVDPKICISDLGCPTCLNDALHWIRSDNVQRSILCFSFESERFQSFPSPPHVFEIRNNRIGELRGFLCICDISLYDITLWVMNEYGIGESWNKVYYIDTSMVRFTPILQHCGLCWPIKLYKEGAGILLYHSWTFFIYYEPEKNEFKVFEIQGTHSKIIEVISHIPSLISLKDVVKGGNIEVLNIHSRCAMFKLPEENEVFSLSHIA